MSFRLTRRVLLASAAASGAALSVGPSIFASAQGAKRIERALAGAATALKERERDDRDDEIAR